VLTCYIARNMLYSKMLYSIVCCKIALFEDEIRILRKRCHINLIYSRLYFEISVSNRVYFNILLRLFKNRYDFALFSIIVGKGSKLLNFLMYRMAVEAAVSSFQSFEYGCYCCYCFFCLVLILFFCLRYTTPSFARHLKN